MRLHFGELSLLSGDIVSETLSRGEYWEDHVYRALEPYLDGDVVDVGANVGAFTLRFAQFAPRVIAFEPNPEMFACLVRNLDYLEMRDRVVAIPEGVYSKPITIAPQKSSYPPSVWTWLPGDRYATTKAGPAVWPEMERRVSAIKTDVQGADLHALLGLETVIVRDRPRIVFEYEEDFSAMHGHTWADYSHQMTVWGYQLQRLEPTRDYFCEPV